MIKKIKKIEVHYEVRSHRFVTEISEEGRVNVFHFLTLSQRELNRKGYLKRLAWHLLDVDKAKRQIIAENQARKEKTDENLPDEK